MTDSRWNNFLIAYLGVLSFTFVFQAVPPILQPVSAELGLNNAQGGLLMGLFALPGILLTIPGGWLTDRLGVKRIGEIALLTMFVGAMGSGLARDFLTLGLARVVAGAGGFILLVTAITLISHSFSGRDLGVAMGVYGTGLPLGTIIGFSLFGYVGDHLGWRSAFFLTGLTALVPLALYRFALENDHFTEGPRLGRSVIDALKQVWPLGLVWLWFNAGMIGFLTFAPEFLHAEGFGSDAANFVAGLTMWGALIVSPSIGPFITNRRRKVLFILVGTVSSAAVLAVMPAAVPYIVPLILLLGLVSALAPAPVFALPADLVDPEHQGIGYGIMGASLNLGVLLGPFLIGWTLDVARSHAAGFYLISGFLILSAVSALPILMKAAPLRLVK